MNKPEILAPAGSLEALHAAVNAGADAVYLGGSRFGARAFADNFGETELIEGIEYAHLYGVKVYMTVNTLFRNEEINDLYDYLLPYYKAGLDAVIVQDFGVMKYIHQHFPDLDIHSSTQMTITTPYAYGLLKDYGVTRIVPARELSIGEIKELKNEKYCGDGLEVEVFVQGALCVCYSGMCLMSSFIGGRSGNRGRCAGSCRLPYFLYDDNGKRVSTEGQYLLSQKDLCSVNSVPDLIKAGVDSFKIEGRMKKPEYVACCVRSYRKLVDYCMSSDFSKDGYEKLAMTCKDEMTEIFNRGGFTKGYFDKHNGKDMMSFNAPGHMGVEIGHITSVNNNSINVKLIKELHKGDILLIILGDEEVTLTSNVDSNSGKEISLNVSKSRKLKKGMTLVRKYDAVLESELGTYYEQDKKLSITGKLALNIGKEAVLEVSCESGGNTFNAVVNGDIVEKASSKPLDKDSVLSKIGQTGDSCFEFSDIDVNMDDNIFYSVKLLKNLRRNALSELESAMRKRSIRETPDSFNDEDKSEKTKINVSNLNNDSVNERTIRVMVSSLEQLDTVVNYSEKNALKIKIAVDLQFFTKSDIIALMNVHPEYSYALPMILRGRSFEEVKSLPLDKCQSLIVRNIDELSYLKSIGYKGELIADYSLYSMNTLAGDFIRSQNEDAVLTMPVEINKKQLELLGKCHENSEIIVYGYQPLMVMASCFTENTKGCNRGSDNSFIMKDRKNQNFYIRAFCKYCYNVIYNGVPTVIYDKLNEVNDYNGVVRFQFVDESSKQINDILDSFIGQGGYPGEYTRGHFARGVD